MKRAATRKLGSWLVPTVLGPIAGMVLLLIARVALGSGSALGLLGWLPVGLGAAVALAIALLLTDVLLLALRLRLPPTGARAWLASSAAVLPFGLCWSLLRPPLLSSPWSHVLAVAAALILAALGTRLLGSPRTSAGMRFASR